MQPGVSRSGFTLVQVVAIGAAVAAAGIGLKLPTLARPLASQEEDPQRQALMNVRQIALASIMYSGDYDDAMPLLINGSWRNMQDVQDGINTTYDEERADSWAVLIDPYIKNRGVFVDPTRGDADGIWSGAPMPVSDRNYGSRQNTYRNQDQFPMYGLNYLFLSPGVIPKDKLNTPKPMDFMHGESHAMTECDDPSGTVYYMSSRHYGDSKRGFFAINAPGLWQALPAKKEFVVFAGDSPCSGDWCYEANTTLPGPVQETNAAYFNSARNAPVVFIDGHARMMTDAELADGTSYLTASPNDGARRNSNLGGCTIVDKDHYLWNLNNNYYGL